MMLENVVLTGRVAFIMHGKLPVGTGRFKFLVVIRRTYK